MYILYFVPYSVPHTYNQVFTLDPPELYFLHIV